MVIFVKLFVKILSYFVGVARIHELFGLSWILFVSFGSYSAISLSAWPLSTSQTTKSLKFVGVLKVWILDESLSKSKHQCLYKCKFELTTWALGIEALCAPTEVKMVKHLVKFSIARKINMFSSNFDNRVRFSTPKLAYCGWVGVNELYTCSG